VHLFRFGARTFLLNVERQTVFDEYLREQKILSSIGETQRCAYRALFEEETLQLQQQGGGARRVGALSGKLLLASVAGRVREHRGSWHSKTLKSSNFAFGIWLAGHASALQTVSNGETTKDEHLG